MGAIIDGDEVHAFCDDCGKDLTVTNIYGMFCEDMCGYEESRQAFVEVDAMVKDITARL